MPNTLNVVLKNAVTLFSLLMLHILFRGTGVKFCGNKGCGRLFFFFFPPQKTVKVHYP